MKRCIKAHTVASFGEIPEGSLWDDDSPYIEQAANFVDADKPVKESSAEREDRLARAASTHAVKLSPAQRETIRNASNPAKAKES